MRTFFNRHYPWLLIMLCAVACWLFYQTGYSYHFYYQEQNQLFLMSADYTATYNGQGWLARLTGDFLTQFYYYRYAGAAILSSLLLLVGVLTFIALHGLGIKRYLSTVFAVILMAVQAIFHLRYDYPLWAELTLTGWSLLLLGMVIVIRLAIRLRQSRHAKASYLRLAAWPLCVVYSLVAVLIGIWLFGAPKTGQLKGPEWDVERLLAVETEYRFGNYDSVVSMVEEDKSPLLEMLFYYNLVMAQRGELPDKLLRYVPNELGTLHQIGPETPMYTIKSMNELYWALGDMTFTERAAMMSCVFSPTNRNVRMVKRLAETNLVSGDTLAARKYLRLLSQTVAYADWAKKAEQDPLYRQKAMLRNQQDTLAVSDNSHFIMMQLLDSNPSNTVALDYMLCTELLLKDIGNFKRDYDRYCSTTPRIKKLYQEALCIWLAGTNASQEEWNRLIVMPDVAQRFSQYNRQRGNKDFSDTYWYYFDTAKPSQP